MDFLHTYVPAEYLALKIDFCQKQLAKLPVVKIHHHNIGGVKTTRVEVGKHRYNPDSPQGKAYVKIKEERNQLERTLLFYESLWNCFFVCERPPDCVSHKTNRTICIDANNQLVMDKAYFDSLKNDANYKYPKPLDYPFDGILYRSAAERDIAMFYTKMGIPFKYEPEIRIKGLPNPIFPDFVLYIKELDNCKIHEHFGIKNSASYIRTVCIKYDNYTNAGLVPGMDVLFSHDTEEIPFDIRAFACYLNSAIYCTAISTKHFANDS